MTKSNPKSKAKTTQAKSTQTKLRQRLATPAPPPLRYPFALQTRLSLAALLDQFQALFPPETVALWLGQQVFYRRAFSPLIILWYLVFQFLSGDATLEAVVEDALEGGADRLSPSGKCLSKSLRSASTASWSDARKRLPEAVALKALRASGLTIRGTVQNRQWHGWDPVLLDGTTYRLRPWGDIPQVFPPHHSGNNAHPYWCLARAVVAFCLATGGVLDCVIGPTKRSEQALVLELLMQSLWTHTLFIADRNFGVYSVVRAAVAAQAQVLFRLTESRAQKLAKEAQVQLRPDLDQRLQWKPSSHDQCPEPLQKTPVDGRLIARRVSPKGFRSFVLYLFTTLVDPQLTVEALAQCYGQRWQVELDLRYVKTQLGLHFLECKSAAMARKLWLAGLMAYNVVRAVMCAAAAWTHQSVLGLSFTRSLKALRKWLPKLGTKAALSGWKRLIRRVARFTLPKRKQARPPEPRAVRYFKQDFAKLHGDRAQAREKLAQKNAKN
jgi:hypothetical protein